MEATVRQQQRDRVVPWAESSLNWLLSSLRIRPGLNTFTLKGLSVLSEGNLLQEHTRLLIHNNNNKCVAEAGGGESHHDKLTCSISAPQSLV